MKLGHANLRTGRMVAPPWLHESKNDYAPSFASGLLSLVAQVEKTIAAQLADSLSTVEAYAASAATPTVRDVAWAFRALLSPGGWPYADDARDRAAMWIAHEFKGLPGEQHARFEVWRMLCRVARREGREPTELLPGLVLAAVPEAIPRASSDLPIDVCFDETLHLLKAIADADGLTTPEKIAEAMAGFQLAAMQRTIIGCPNGGDDGAGCESTSN
jgi:hypothetical protein